MKQTGDESEENIDKRGYCLKAKPNTRYAYTKCALPIAF